MALICAAGHALAGRRMFYQPIKSAITDATQSGVFTGMWRLITINFAVSAAALLVAGMSDRRGVLAWLVAAQFAGYAFVYLVLSLRLGSALALFQWIPFAATAVLRAAGAVAAL